MTTHRPAATDGPKTKTFTPAGRVSTDAVMWTKVPDDYPCGECRARGGWLPKVDQSDCPECLGADSYGQPSYCAECDFCCGC